jgi:hypothetical protein
MDSEPAVTRVVLPATSVLDDVGFVALADIADLLGAQDYRVIGGHMVTLLVARWGLGPELYRATADTDLGVPPVAVNGSSLIDALMARGYERVAANRFGRTMSDLPRVESGQERAALVDVLVPAYTSRARTDRKFGNHLVTTEVPGLAVALQRPPVVLDVEMIRLNHEVLRARLLVPDEVSALVLKAAATQVRGKSTDQVDLWRCLEVAYAAGIGAGDFVRDEEFDAARRVRQLLGDRTAPGVAAIVTEQQLSERAADERSTRIRALIERVLPENAD